MILGDILGCPVTDDRDRKLGYAVDARFVLDGSVAAGNPHSPEAAEGGSNSGGDSDSANPHSAEAAGGVIPAARLHGFIVSPHTRSSFLGYARTGVNAPAALAGILAWRHRGSFLVLWRDVAAITAQGISLRPGFTKYKPGLHESQGN
jgi:hypothetical protein